MKEKHNILGVHLTDRFTEAALVQQLFTDFGRYIKTRLGLHEPDKADPSGIILLEMLGPDEKVAELEQKLAGIEGVETNLMTFEHELG